MKSETRRLVFTTLLTIAFAVGIEYSVSENQSKITSHVVTSDEKLTSNGYNMRLVKDLSQLDELIDGQKVVEETKKTETVETKKEEEVITVDVAIVEETPVTSAETNLTLANQIVAFAKQFLGNPYVYGGTSLTNGADCSGFVQSVFSNFNIKLNRSAPDQVNNGINISVDNVQPGDIILYGYNGVICHSSMYIGNGQIIHAMNSDSGIVISSYNIMPIISIRRVL